MAEKIVALVLAGGKGSRLRTLTDKRSKPAVEFAGKWRIIDFVLNNLVNSGVNQIKVLTQYRAESLIDHLVRFWVQPSFNGPYISFLPAEQGDKDNWYQGTADAVYQNIRPIEKLTDMVTVGVFAGDHIYKVDVADFHKFHNQKRSEFTICAHVVPVQDASGFGIIEVDDNFRVVGFQEKPENPKQIPGRPGYCLASTGNYLIEKESLIRVLTEDAAIESSSHDFGKDIIPAIVERGDPIYVYDLSSHIIKGELDVYWRDVGTLSSYLEAHMDLVGFEPRLNLYNTHWPMRTFPDNLSPAKIVRGAMKDEEGRCMPFQFFILSGGCLVDGASLDGVVLSREVKVMACSIKESVLCSGVTVGAGSRLNRVIVDKEVNIPENTEIGFDENADLERGFVVEDGVTLVPKNYIFPK